jgi:hypothetical protein
MFMIEEVLPIILLAVEKICGCADRILWGYVSANVGIDGNKRGHMDVENRSQRLVGQSAT